MIKQLTDSDFNDKTSKQGFVIVELTADWCEFCKKLEPILQEISNEFPIDIYQLNIDTNKIAKNYMLKSFSNGKFTETKIPLLLLFVNGELSKQREGFGTKEEIINWINNPVNTIIYSDIIKHIINATIAIKNKDLNSLLIADAAALEAVQFWPATKDNVIKKHRLLSSNEYVGYQKLDPTTRLLWFTTGGPYQNYIKNKSPNNGVSSELEEELKNVTLANPKSSENNLGKIALGLGLAGLIVYVITK